MIFDGWPHIVKSQQFSREWLEQEFFPLVREMQRIVNQKERINILPGKMMFSLFYQPSTRTRFSFERAMKLLGGDVIQTENAREFSSAYKGEILEDTIEVLGVYYPDVIVLRYHEKGGAVAAARVSEVPIINAGDGPGQHPTQALLDIFTILEKLKRVDGISIAIVGDLLGRVVRSLSYLLAKFDVKIYFVSPESLRIGEDIKAYLRKHNIQFVEEGDLRVVAHKVDVVYQTRTQKEYGSEIDGLNMSQGFCVVNKEVTGLLRGDAIIMHPLPIDREGGEGEIALEVDKDPRSVYKKDQIKSGLSARMALLKMLLS